MPTDQGSRGFLKVTTESGIDKGECSAGLEPAHRICLIFHHLSVPGRTVFPGSLVLFPVRDVSVGRTPSEEFAGACVHRPAQVTDPSHISGPVDDPELDKVRLVAGWLCQQVKMPRDHGAILRMDEFVHQRWVAQEFIRTIPGDVLARGGDVKKPALRIDPIVPIARGIRDYLPEILGIGQVRSSSCQLAREAERWRKASWRGLFREGLALFLFGSGRGNADSRIHEVLRGCLTRGVRYSRDRMKSRSGQ